MAPLVWGALWVIGAAATAMLPLRRQMWPGMGLLVTAPVLLAWIAFAVGWVWTLVALGVLGSVFRRPLAHLGRRAMGRPSESFEEMVAREEGR